MDGVRYCVLEFSSILPVFHNNACRRRQSAAEFRLDLCQIGVIHAIPAIPACPVRPRRGTEVCTCTLTVEGVAGVCAVQSQIENYGAKAKEFARLTVVAKSLGHSRQYRKLAEMYWALALGEEPDAGSPQKRTSKGTR